MNEKKRSFFAWLAALVLSVLIILITLFANWLGVILLGDTTLLKVAGLVGRLSNLLDGGKVWMVIAAILIYAALADTLICGIATLWMLHKARKEGGTIFHGLFTQVAVLSAIVIVLIAIGNTIINVRAGGWVKDILHLTAAPFLVLLFAAAGFVLACACKIEPFSFSDLSSIAPAAPTPAAPTAKEEAELYCPTCKKTVPGGRKFCTACGTALVSARTCPKCGKPVAPEAVFCVYCGCDIAKFEEENRDYTCECGKTFTRQYIRENNLKFCPQCGHPIQ